MLWVVIVGGGASGALTALAVAGTDAAVTVVERSERLGPGLAYGAADEHHLLNSPAGRMSAVPAREDHFVEWCASRGDSVDPAAFAPRRRYGDYLEDVVGGLVAAGRIDRVRGEAVALDDSTSAVLLRDGRTLPADRVVLALGNPPPAGRGLDPWSAGSLDGARGNVLLVGTGLTMVDAATRLARRDPDVRLTATGRTLRLPRVHLDRPQPAGPGLRPAGPALRDVLAAVRERLRAARSEGRAWQAEVDGIRPQVNALWAALPPADRQRFVRHVSRTWEVHRHRMAPAVAAEVADLQAAGRLTIGRVDGTAGFDAVVDCTGPRPIPSRGWNPLLDSLLATGRVQADRLGLGIAVDADGAPIDRRGRPSPVLTVIGPARRGTEWECTAVPEIRAQATAYAASFV